MYDPTDNRGVPQSKGIPMAVRIAGVVGLLAIFVIGGITCKMSDFGHQWPASKVLRYNLNHK